MPPKNRQKGTSSETPTFKKPPRTSLQKKKSKKKVSSSFSWMWGFVASLVAFLAWIFSSQTLTPAQQFIKSFVCESEGGLCHSALMPTRRTMLASKKIPKNNKLIEIPRKLQIWDLDALRDDFVQSQLLGARHVDTALPLESGAFLAAYLALRILENAEDDPLRPYFDILPSYEELLEFHPALWADEDIQELGPFSSSHAVVKGYQDMIESEYHAFAHTSSDFSELISRDAFRRMRVIVLSRGFGIETPGPEEALPGVPLEEELESYKSAAGVDLTKGFNAMVPLLDMFDHHARPNVVYKYDTEKSAFVVHSSNKGIAAGVEVMDSYGKYTDPHLYAKYGFVNGDGSGYTQASIAALHKPLDVGIKQFSYLPVKGPDESFKLMIRQVMVRYLRFDEGYEECIEPDKHPDAYELKSLKLEHLVRIANKPDRWVGHVGPRRPLSKPAPSTMYPITMEAPRFTSDTIQFDGHKLIATCRLLSLKEEDFDGTSTEMLRNSLEDDSELLFEGGGDALEYRALMCLTRLTGIKIWMYHSEVSEEIKHVEQLNKNNFQSREWAMAHVRFGEIETLSVLRQLGFSGSHEKGELIKAKLGNESDAVLPYFRLEQCSEDFSRGLVDLEPVETEAVDS